MKKAINVLINGVVNAIANDLSRYPYTNQDVFDMVLKAYNDYQESERDGVDYIFDINKTEDLKCCVEGGMTAREIGKLWTDSHSTTTKYFYFGCNYLTPKPIASYEELVTNLINWLDDVVPCVLAYPYAYESYKSLYTRYVTDIIIDYPNELRLSDIDALAELKAKLEEGE